MIAAQDIGFTSSFTAREWVLLIGLIAALTLILVMAQKLRDLQAEKRRLIYNEALYQADLPDTEDVFVRDYHGRNDPVDEIGTRNEIDKFFEGKPGVDPKAKRNT